MKYAHIAFGFAAGALLMFSTNSVAQNFPDVNTTDWFSQYVQKIAQWGIISGNDDGTFAPGRAVVRAELGKMFVLFDERTDAKIEAAQTQINLMVDQKVQTTALGTSSQNVPSSMVLKIRNSQAPACPENWTEVASGFRGSENIRLNTRSCIIDKSCEVLEIVHHNNKKPDLCPENWTEASYGKVENDDWLRTCFVCAS